MTKETKSVAAAVRRTLGIAGGTLLALTSLGVGTAVAQETQAGESSSPVLDVVTVTGTRIVRDGYEAPTPISVLGNEQLAKMATTNLADSVNRLPSLSGGRSSHNYSGNVSSGTAGINTLNLRGLGASRTLVLLDGKRMVPATLGTGDSATGAPDVNAIPTALIQRVEIVTGGASAVYGSDALAGVVNFILDKEFTGVKGSAQYGETTYGDNESQLYSVAMGTPFADSRGHVLLSAEWAGSDEIRGNDRPWNDAGYQLITNPRYQRINGVGNGQPELIHVYNTGLGQATPGGLITGCYGVGAATASQSCLLRGTDFVEDGRYLPFNFGSVISNPYMSGGDWERSRNDNLQSLTMQMERSTAFGRASFDVTDNTAVYAELGYSKTRAINHHALRTFDFNLQISRDNPFLPAEMRQYMLTNNFDRLAFGTVNADLPPVQGDNTRTFKRYALGAEGTFDMAGDEWAWDAYVQRSTTEALQTAPGNRINANYTRAINSTRDASGRIVCAVNADANPANDDPACLPYNPFGIGVNSQAVVDYITEMGRAEQELTQDVVAVSASGTPFDSWAGPISLAFGAEHRREKVEGVASALDEASQFFAGNWHASRGDYNVTEGFVETVVPLAKDLPFAQAIDLNAAARWTDYSTSGDVVTWKLGTTWQPIEDIRFRLTRSRDIRAPSLGDLFNSGQSGGSNFTDPRIDPVTGTKPQYLVTSITTGNPLLVPEEADTTGIGVVFSPRFLPGFTMSIDYYHIEIEGAIASLGAQTVADRCEAGFTELCQYVIRGANGRITTVINKPQNILGQEAAGYDVEMSYRFPIGPGDLELRALGTYFDKLETQDSTGRIVDGSGMNAAGAGVGFGNALLSPKYRYLVSAAYNWDPVTATLTMRGVSSGKYNNNFIVCTSGCPTSTLDNPTVDSNHIDGAKYFDLSFNGKLLDTGAELFLVVENILNEEPALVAGTRGGGYYNGQDNADFYDRLGRYYRAGVRFQF